MKELKCNDFEVVKHVYKNGITYKFGSRRATVINNGKGFGLQFKTLDSDPSPCVQSEFLRGKLHITSFNLSKEATELLMFAIAELYDLECVDKSMFEEMQSELDFYKSQNNAMSDAIDKMQNLIP